MSAYTVRRLLTTAAISAPLLVAGPAAASGSGYTSCSGTANHGDQSAIKVRHVTCTNAINFLNKIAKLAPTSTKQDGPDTVATLKTTGWVCTVRFVTPTAKDPNVSTTAHGNCTASHKRAIKWTKK
jgi:hypothetical protein